MIITLTLPMFIFTVGVLLLGAAGIPLSYFILKAR